MATDETRCGTCKHWQKPRDDWYGADLRAEGYDDSDAYDHEATIALNRLYRTCQRIEMPDTYGEKFTPETAPLAYTMDGSQYRADLLTRAEFGCVLWESCSNSAEPPSVPSPDPKSRA